MLDDVKEAVLGGLKSQPKTFYFDAMRKRLNQIY
jgi:hypothetical protein